MIKNKSFLNQYARIRKRNRGANTTHCRTRRGLVGCARLRRGDCCRGHRQTLKLVVFYLSAQAVSALDTVHFATLARLFVHRSV